MIDYSDIATKALGAVTNAGRAVTFVRLATTKDDSAKPWEGTTNPRGTPAATVQVRVVAVPPSSAVKLGLSADKLDFMKKATQILIVAPGPTLTDDLADFHEVLDEGVTWRITGVETLRPADVTLLYFVGVTR